MIDTVLFIGKLLLCLIPFAVFVRMGRKNLKKEMRSRQFLMPFIALLYSFVVVFFMTKISDLILRIINLIPGLLLRLSAWLSAFLRNILDGKLGIIATIIEKLANLLSALLSNANKEFLMLIAVNTVIVFVFIILKRLLLPILKRVFKTGNRVHDKVSPLCYSYDVDSDTWFLKPELSYARLFAKICFIAVFVISIIAVNASAVLFRWRMLVSLFYPVFSIIVIGEVFYYLDGVRKDEVKSSITGENDEAETIVNYAIIRKALRNLFGDKLVAENTTIANTSTGSTEYNVWLDEKERSMDNAEMTYSQFFKSWIASGKRIDIHYLQSGLDLLKKKSILFNNPFYYDLIPYIPFAMDRTLLGHKKVLVVAGRHGTVEDIMEWVEAGLLSVSNIPELWRVGELTTDGTTVDVGVLSKANLHNPDVLAANKDFLNETEFVMLIEPSRLLPAAQVGLNSLVRFFRDRVNKVAFCSVDKNCDGLVDSLSHILMTSIAEVSATEKHGGACSYMCWAPDDDYLQHRMFPNVSRYLGVGTELSFAALKEQVPETKWYGGDRFPVIDMRWVASQYYYDLLDYAELPTEQSVLDQYFKVSYNLWNESRKENNYITVEDESFNLMETKRAFATRASNQSFINVISSEYLLRDYMAENSQLFDTDPKAIPYIVADYAHTKRNVALRLCLRMSAGYVNEEDLRRELMLIGIREDDLLNALWRTLCECSMPINGMEKDEEGRLVIIRNYRDKKMTFTSDVIKNKRQYLIETGRIENTYHIENQYFIETILGDLENVSIIAEVEDAGDSTYLGSELAGDIFQKYLPGQFLTLNGKYYEMLNVTQDGEMVVRRASEHLNERVFYRQIRKYNISNEYSLDEMGSQRDLGSIRVLRQHADIRVSTQAYWKMHTYNDFSSARRIEINGIPDRTYYNKPIIRIDFPGMDDEQKTRVLPTITLLMNELFLTLFAENSSYIVATTKGEFEEPITYDISFDNVSNADGASIYVIEDTQMDIGLLSAFERNIDRILATICDYLEWHVEAVEKSANPPVDPVPTGIDTQVIIPLPPKEEKKGLWQRFKDKIKKLFGSIFKKKKKGDDDVKDVPNDEEAGVEDGAEEPTENGGIDINDESSDLSGDEGSDINDGEEAPEIDSNDENVETDENVENGENDGNVENDESDENGEIADSSEGEDIGVATPVDNDEALNKALKEILPVFDSISYGLAQLSEEDLQGGTGEGMRATQLQMLQSLEKMGVYPIAAEGEEFNPEVHEAVEHIKDATYPSNFVVKEVRKGFKKGEKLLRASQVVVAN